jgi:hypothetical protein
MVDSNKLVWRRIVEGISRITDARMVQSSHPTVLSLMSQRDRKRSRTHAPAIVTKAVPTLVVKGPVLRVGA